MTERILPPHGWTKRWVGKAAVPLGGALFFLLTGCTTYVEAPPPHRVYVPPPPPPMEAPVAPMVVIRTESDFYEPLNPYGRWVIVEPYGRCWVPTRMEAGWQPYSNGHWQRTEAGWYWVSEEPWGWATYHYGRWDWNAELGWIWVPQTRWAPAWVSFHQGGGYVGWAPLHPSARVTTDDFVDVKRESIAPRAYVFVEDRKFLEPVHSETVVVNNTTIINKTVNITNIKIVNNTVVNEGPRTTVIEQATGKGVQTIPVHELRRQQEAAVLARQQTSPQTSQRPTSLPARNEILSPERKTPVESERRAKEAQAKAQEEGRKSAREAELKAAQVASEGRATEEKRKALEEEQRKAKLQEQTAARLESERRAKEAQAKAQEEVRKSAREAELKAAQVASERRATEEKTKALEEEQRKAKLQEQRTARLESERRAREPAMRPATKVQTPGQGPADGRTTSARVKKALEINSQYKGVTVVMSKGVLQLGGFVKTPDQKERAGELAKKVQGVHEVQNNIVIRE